MLQAAAEEHLENVIDLTPSQSANPLYLYIAVRRINEIMEKGALEFCCAHQLSDIFKETHIYSLDRFFL
ncbi:MAG: hypothetical protein Tsb0015_12320 [Simkaniaceae bacterium]